MTIPVWIGVEYASTNAGTSVTVDISVIDSESPPTVGDFLIAECSIDGVSSAVNEHIRITSSDKGWRRVNNAHHGQRSAMFWKIRESGDDDTIEFESLIGTSEQMIAAIACVRGVDPIKPIARYSCKIQTTDDPACLAETTPVADCLALSWYTMDDDQLPSSPASGWTERLDVETTDSGMYLQTQEFASASSSTGTATLPDIGGAEEIIGRMIVLQPPQDLSTKDIKVAAGRLDSPTDTGNQDITGLGFDCKALIIWSMRTNTTTPASDIIYTRGIGADDGVTTAAQRYAGVWHESGGGDDCGYSGTGEIIKVYNVANTSAGSPDLAATYSKIADGFRLNWATVEGSERSFFFIAFGGDDLRAACGAELASTSPVSGLPWRPDVTHVLGQCIASDSDQLRTGAGILSAGWIDHQSGGQWSFGFDLAGENSPGLAIRDSGFYSQNSSGALTYELQFQQTTSDGWSWSGTNADYFSYLSLNFGAGSDGDTNYPFEIEFTEALDSGGDGADQTLPVFADGAEKQIIHAFMGDESTETDYNNASLSEGFWTPSEQSVFALGKAGTTSERVRHIVDTFLGSIVGNLDSLTRIGDFTDQDTINWSENDNVAVLIGLFTLGRMPWAGTGATTTAGTADLTFNKLSFSGTGATVTAGSGAFGRQGIPYHKTCVGAVGADAAETDLVFAKPSGLSVGDLMVAWLGADAPTDESVIAGWQTPDWGNVDGDKWVGSQVFLSAADGVAKSNVQWFWKFAEQSDLDSWDGTWISKYETELEGIICVYAGVDPNNPFVTGEDYGPAIEKTGGGSNFIDCANRTILPAGNVLTVAMGAGCRNSGTSVTACEDNADPADYTLNANIGIGEAGGVLLASASREWVSAEGGNDTDPYFTGAGTSAQRIGLTLQLRGGSAERTVPDVWVEVGKFTSPSGTGDFDVDLVGNGKTGISETKAVYFWGVGNKSDGGSASVHFEAFFGIATLSENRAIKFWSENGAADSFRGQNESACIDLNAVNNDGAGTITATLAASGVDKFTVNFSTAVSGYIINFMAIGGSDASADIVQFAGASASVATAIDPELVFTLCAGLAAGTTNGAGTIFASIGAFNDRGGAFHTAIERQQSDADGKSIFRPQGFSGTASSGGGSMWFEKQIEEMNPDAFEFNERETINTDVVYALVLNLSGLRTMVRHIGAYNGGSDDTDQDLGNPFRVQAAMFQLNSNNSPQINDGNIRFSQGAYDESTQVGIGIYGQDSATNTDQIHMNDAVVLVGTDCDPSTAVNGLEGAMQDRDTIRWVEAGTPTDPYDLAIVAFEGAEGVARELDGTAESDSDGDGELHRARPVDGTAESDSNASGDLDVSRELTGVGESDSDADAALDVARELSGTAESDSDADGELDRSRGLSGDAESDSNADGTLSRSRGVDGIAESDSDGDATLDAARELNGVAESDSDADATITIDTVVALTGIAESDSSGAATLDVARELSGTAESTSDGSADITIDTATALDGIAESDSNADGTLDVSRPLDGVAESTSNADGTLDAARELSGVAESDSDGDATITIDTATALDGIAESGSDGDATLDVGRPLDGVAESDSDGDAILTLDEEVNLNGIAESDSNGDATLDVSRDLAGVAESDSAADGELDAARELSGVAESDSDGNATITIDTALALDGVAESDSGSDGDLDVARELSGAAESDSDGDGDLTVAGLIALNGTAESDSNGTADLDVARELAGVGASDSDSDGDLDVSRELAGVAESVSSADGNILRGRGADGIAESDSSADATLDVDRPLSGIAESESSGDAIFTLDEEVNLNGIAESTSNGDAELDASRELAGTAETDSDADGALDCGRPLDGIAESDSDADGYLSTAVLLDGVAGSISDGDAALSCSRPFDGVAESDSYASGSICVALLFIGTAESASDADGDIEVFRLFNGIGESISDGNATITVDTDLLFDGIAESTSSADGVLDCDRPIAGVSESDSDGDATLDCDRPIAGTGESDSDADGELLRERFFDGIAESDSDADGEMIIDTVVSYSGIAQSTSTASGDIEVLREMSGVAESDSDADGLITIIVDPRTDLEAHIFHYEDRALVIHLEDRALIFRR